MTLLDRLLASKATREEGRALKRAVQTLSRRRDFLAELNETDDGYAGRSYDLAEQAALDLALTILDDLRSKRKGSDGSH